jgi:hypothetical protein
MLIVIMLNVTMLSVIMLTILKRIFEGKSKEALLKGKNRNGLSCKKLKVYFQYEKQLI